MNGTVMRLAGVVTATLLLGGATAAAKPAAAGADLRVSATLDQSRAYVENETIPVTVTVTNVGDADATAVRGTVTGEHLGNKVSSQPSSWKDFVGFPPKGTVRPGETHVLVVLVDVSAVKAAETKAVVKVIGAQDADPGDNSAPIGMTMVLPSVVADVSGQVYGDRDNDGGYDEGEGIGGVRMGLSGRTSQPIFAVTGPDGRFTFPAVAAGLYSVSRWVEIPGGWVPAPRTNDVRVAGTTTAPYDR